VVDNASGLERDKKDAVRHAKKGDWGSNNEKKSREQSPGVDRVKVGTFNTVAPGEGKKK